MRTRVRKWGNSLALRIPRPLALEAGLAEDTLVDVRPIDGKLLVTPVPARGPTLEDLLAGVTAQNLHSEVPTGPAAGREQW